MALSTYADVKSAVAAWTHRNDLTDRIADFVAIADSRINRLLATREHEIETELAMSAGSRYVALPAGVNYPLGLWLKAWLPRQKLTQVLPTELPVKTNVSGYPEYWSIDGANIAFDKLASAAHTFDFRYVADKSLNDSNPTNYVLSNYPDLYLWGSLVEASQFTKDNDGVSLYEQRFQQALTDALNNENSRIDKVPLTTEMGVATRGWRFNINRGY